MTNPESLPMTGSPQFSCKLEMFLWLIRHQDDPLVQSWWIGYEAAQRGVTLERALVLRDALKKILEKLPEASIIEALKADKGLGYRHYQAKFSDKEVTELRALWKEIDDGN